MTTGISRTTFPADTRAWGHRTDVPVGSLASHGVAGRDLPRSRTSLRSLRRSTATPRSLAIPGPRIGVVRPTPPPTRPPRPRSSVRAFRAFRCVSPHRPTDGARSGLLRFRALSALSERGARIHAGMSRIWGHRGIPPGFSLGARPRPPPQGRIPLRFAGPDRRLLARRASFAGPANGRGPAPSEMAHRRHAYSPGRPRAADPPRRRRRDGGSLPQPSADSASTRRVCCATAGAASQSLARLTGLHTFIGYGFPVVRVSSASAFALLRSPPRLLPAAAGELPSATTRSSRTDCPEGLAPTRRAHTASTPLAGTPPRPRDPTTRERATVALRLRLRATGPATGYTGVYRG
ncbi:hypothetical protein SAMN05216559_3575 [Halomicrobium zhouii]|uniref:Uncharacterized protein n=1 Tax=Halomicrobium zhouii TaxID=767519 RepID=A0A1I6M203_9EURY|nr:hypothetical protein SAMN05216559_3575 [Halomicrobium zhouii]